jgi:hypothetical protein
MQTWVIQDRGFNGGVKLNSKLAHQFYEYSLWHARTGEHLFDGVAGDLAEAVDSLLAHIHFLAAANHGAFAAGD